MPMFFALFVLGQEIIRIDGMMEKKMLVNNTGTGRLVGS